MSATSMGPAFAHNHRHGRIQLDGEAVPYMDYCFPYVALYNLTGQPVLTVPSGLSDEGLPVGISFAGGHHHEALLLHLAQLLSEHGVQFTAPELS
jgi:amidase